MRHSLTGTLSIASAVFACVASASPAMAFSDVAASRTDADSIEYVFKNGIVQGYADGTYGPDKTINRAELTKIIVGATTDRGEIDGCDLSTLSFRDVSRTAWYAPYVCAAKARGIVSGYLDGTFKPEQPVTFTEAAKIVANGFALKLPAATGEWYEQYVLALEERRGIPLSIKRLDSQLTRGEMAGIIFRLKTDPGLESLTLEKLRGNVALPSDMPTGVFGKVKTSVLDTIENLDTYVLPFSEQDYGDDSERINGIRSIDNTNKPIRGRTVFSSDYSRVARSESKRSLGLSRVILDGEAGQYESGEVFGLLFSPSGKHVAYSIMGVMKGGKAKGHVMLDSSQVVSFDGEVEAATMFSPDESLYTTIADRGNNQRQVYKDLKHVEDYYYEMQDGFANDYNMLPVFSDDGSAYAYRARREKSFFIVTNDGELSTDYYDRNGPGPYMFADGTLWMQDYVSAGNGILYRTSLHKPGTSSFESNAEYESDVWPVMSDNKKYMVFDAESNAGSKSVHVMESNGNKKSTPVSGRAFPAGMAVSDAGVPAFIDIDSTSSASLVVADGKRGALFSKVEWPLVFRNDQRTVAYIAGSDSGPLSLIVGDKPIGEEFYNYVNYANIQDGGAIVHDPVTDNFAFVAQSKPDSKEQRLYVNGVPGKSYDRITSFSFIEGVPAYVADVAKTRKRTLVIGSEEIATYDDIWMPIYDKSGGLLIFAARDGNEIIRVEIPFQSR